MNGAYDIDVWGLVLALGMVAAAAIISELMHMGIGRTLMWSACRALVQLCAMGFIISYVIRSNSVWMVFALMTVMLIAAVQIVMSRAHGIPKGLAGPIFLSLVITMLLMLALVTELIVRPHPWYAPQLVVPLTGMLLGNTVSALAVGLSRFYESMEERRDEVDMMLALGATAWESARPSVISSIRLGLLPTTASLASSGIVTIPGMMTGQVIAGGDPPERRQIPVRGLRRHRRADLAGRRPDHGHGLSHLLHRRRSIPTTESAIAGFCSRCYFCFQSCNGEAVACDETGGDSHMLADFAVIG